MANTPICQCAKDPDLGPCLEAPTQEDILCDGCRQGCARVTFIIGDQPPVTSNHVALYWENVAVALNISPGSRCSGLGLLPDGVGHGHD